MPKRAGTVKNVRFSRCTHAYWQGNDPVRPQWRYSPTLQGFWFPQLKHCAGALKAPRLRTPSIKGFWLTLNPALRRRHHPPWLMAQARSPNKHCMT